MRIFLLFFTIFIVSANAYCIKNDTNQKLFFMVDAYLPNGDTVVTFKNHIKAKESKCCSANNLTCNPTQKDYAKLSFYAFFDKDAIEGCDVFGTASSNISLDSYLVFDNCFWSESKL